MFMREVMLNGASITRSTKFIAYLLSLILIQ